MIRLPPIAATIADGVWITNDKWDFEFLEDMKMELHDLEESETREVHVMTAYTILYEELTKRYEQKKHGTLQRETLADKALRAMSNMSKGT